MDKASEYVCADAREAIPRWLCEEASSEEVHALQQHLRECPDCHASFLASSASQFFGTQDAKRQAAHHAARISVDDVGVARIA
ncbi:MAG: zf-HC2 domain-containing protein [Planctomycetes bacterium]|nr:zf-HC2 domain-containing protein [Planctomycetota bacterium]